jgi:phytoene dehydrogenase-like protein
MTSTTDAPFVIIGGGIAGLTAGALLGRASVPAVVLEKSSAPGGRAATRDRNGFLFNLGPHALYRGGHLRRTLTDLGVDVGGGIATGHGGFALLDGRRHTLPAGLTSLITTGLLSLPAKFELARFQTRLPAIDASAMQRATLSSWLDGNVRDRRVRQVLEMLVRVTTFTNDPEQQSAGAALEQMQLGVRGSVLYLNGGWQTIVDGLRRVAIAGGVRVVSNAHAVGLERSAPRRVDGVRMSDGSAMRVSGIVIAAGPGDVDKLTGSSLATTLPPPIRIATLDVALRSLPKPNATVAFGIDTPVYFSVHSAIARLAPDGGALIHVSKYLPPDAHAGQAVEHELESLLDMMQPGWRERLVTKQYLPSLTVSHAELTAALGGVKGRPASRLPAFDNVCIAGDWVGPRGQLSDASAASAADAAAHLADGRVVEERAS